MPTKTKTRKSLPLKTKTTLPKQIFSVKVNPQLVAQAVRVYLSNQRQGTKKAKTRGEISGSRRKIWRQKGTGRARHGDRYAPIFVGGGVAHGPTGQENYKKTLSKKMRRQALLSALTIKAQDQAVIITPSLEPKTPKTKLMLKTLQQLTDYQSGQKLTLVLSEPSDTITRSSRNLPGVNTVLARNLHPYLVLNSHKLIFTKDSLNSLKETFLK